MILLPRRMKDADRAGYFTQARGSFGAAAARQTDARRVGRRVGRWTSTGPCYPRPDLFFCSVSDFVRTASRGCWRENVTLRHCDFLASTTARADLQVLGGHRCLGSWFEYGLLAMWF